MVSLAYLVGSDSDNLSDSTDGVGGNVFFKGW